MGRACYNDGLRVAEKGGHSMIDEREACTGCQGTGKDWFDDAFPCWHCGGSGKHKDQLAKIAADRELRKNLKTIADTLGESEQPLFDDLE